MIQFGQQYITLFENQPVNKLATPDQSYRVNGPGTPHPPPVGGFEPYIILKYNILAIQNRLAIEKKRWFHRVIAL